MNLEKIFIKQRELDNSIIQKSKAVYASLTTEQRHKLSKISLLIEICEFMNELETFKYWKQHRKNNINKIKEELADVLHFIISWAVLKNVNPTIEPQIINGDPNDQFIEIVKAVNKLFDDDSTRNVTYALELIIGLAQIIGLSQSDIEQSYLAKNKINWDRINNNY
ncbi:Uncharacterized protein conserved in bacteria [Mycoplasmopsis californica]|uniref:dUTP diphosphatase n=1 Tax=Mycoplasmopsis equigenitalium TaxID=114883 RepID=A0ABY5J0W7_9BACT|nr:dUTP diphosphatase [Mycoplasmopsis equigenitalium]UUD36899.1 dUTP diphosphatase [Mycoplasmopsis equigenitalium]VEU69806.1 Uncharacterized protein conserved in bacteria [Mycoplasmopsis californica]